MGAVGDSVACLGVLKLASRFALLGVLGAEVFGEMGCNTDPGLLVSLRGLLGITHKVVCVCSTWSTFICLSCDGAQISGRCSSFASFARNWDNSAPALL